MTVDRRRFFASLVGLPVAGAVAGAAAAAETAHIQNGVITWADIQRCVITDPKMRSAGSLSVTIAGAPAKIPYYD